MSADSCIQRAPPGCSMRRHGTICFPVAATSSLRKLGFAWMSRSSISRSRRRIASRTRRAVRAAVEVVQRETLGLHRWRSLLQGKRVRYPSRCVAWSRCSPRCCAPVRTPSRAGPAPSEPARPRRRRPARPSSRPRGSSPATSSSPRCRCGRTCRSATGPSTGGRLREREYRVLRARERDWLELDTELGPLRASWGLLAATNPDPLQDLPGAARARARRGPRRGGSGVLRGGAVGRLPGRSPSLRDPRRAAARGRALGPGDRVARRAHPRARARGPRGGRARRGPAQSEALAREPARRREHPRPDLPRGRPDQPRLRAAELRAATGPLRLARGAGRAARRSTKELRAAVLEAEAFRPIARYEGRGGRFELVEDAYGSRVWTLATPERVGYSRLAQAPAYYTNGPATRLVVRLPVGRDPLRDAARYQSAELWNGPDRVAVWSAGGGLAAPDLRGLAERLPDHGRGRGVGGASRRAAAPSIDHRAQRRRARARHRLRRGASGRQREARRRRALLPRGGGRAARTPSTWT